MVSIRLGIPKRGDSTAVKVHRRIAQLPQYTYVSDTNDQWNGQGTVRHSSIRSRQIAANSRGATRRCGSRMDRGRPDQRDVPDWK